MAKEGGHAVTLPAGGQVDNALWRVLVQIGLSER